MSSHEISTASPSPAGTTTSWVEWPTSLQSSSVMSERTSRSTGTATTSPLAKCTISRPS